MLSDPPSFSFDLPQQNCLQFVQIFLALDIDPA